MSSESSGRTLIAVATYNERDSIEPLLNAIFEHVPDAGVLIIDDASPDGTGALADAYAQRDRRVRVMHRAGKLGLGTAHMDAMRYALDNQYEYIITMDADLSHPPRYLPDLLAGMDRHDVMIGSRYVPGGRIIDWTWTRKLMSRCINWYSRLLLGIRARDTSGAFRCYRVEKLRSIDFDRVLSRGYSFQEEFLFHCQRVGCRIGETPITFENRRHGHSKISLREVVRALWNLLYVALRRGTGKPRV